MGPRLRILLSALLVILLTIACRHRHPDDSLIYFRYVRNALDGLGLVFNAGEHINALTSPLYTYLLLCLSWLLHGNIAIASALLFACPLIAACALAERLFPYSGLLVASMSYFYTTAGMETSLLLFLLILALTLILSERLAWLPLALALLVLTRIEAGALIPVCLVYLYRQKKWPPVVSYLPALAVLAASLILNHHFFGTFSPQSASAKLGQGRSGYWGSWPLAFFVIKPLFTASKGALYTIPMLAVAGILGIFRMRKTKWNALALPFAGIMLAFYVLFNIPNYHWYYAPFLFILALYSVASLPVNRVAGVLVGCVIVAQSIAAAQYLSRSEERPEDYKQVADWINQNANPSASLETCEIGEIGWESNHRVIDIIGLTEPKNADHIAHKDVVSWLAEDRPDYIVMHRKTWVFEKVASESPDYEVAPCSAGDVYLLRRKGVVDKSNDSLAQRSSSK